MRVVVVTGLAGAGKTTALHALEDLNHFCVDNLPLPLVGKFIELVEGNDEVEKVALVVDAREGEFLRDYQASVDTLRQEGHTVDASPGGQVPVPARHVEALDDLGVVEDRAILEVLEDVVHVVNINNRAAPQGATFSLRTEADKLAAGVTVTIGGVPVTVSIKPSGDDHAVSLSGPGGPSVFSTPRRSRAMMWPRTERAAAGHRRLSTSA